MSDQVLSEGLVGQKAPKVGNGIQTTIFVNIPFVNLFFKL